MSFMDRTRKSELETPNDEVIRGSNICRLSSACLNWKQNFTLRIRMFNMMSTDGDCRFVVFNYN